MNKPIAVLISDVHYNLPNLKLADASLRMAIKKANELDVQLWITGDLHDTKANLRSECLNALIETLRLARKHPRILIGNHDLINEKSKEHSLSVLDVYYAEIIDAPTRTAGGLHFLPYSHSSDRLRDYIATIPAHSTIIMHQGIIGSNMGDYVQDKSALRLEDVAGHRVISGHYHARQTIALPNGGVWDYVGNPFTVSYGEANDPEKGFQILMDDGSLEFMPTNLRKHIIMDIDYRTYGMFPLEYQIPEPGDLIWIKARGTKELLSLKSKEDIANDCGLNDTYTFRLDLIPTDSVIAAPKSRLPEPELLDSLIDSMTETSDACKARLKDKWKTMI